MKNQLIKHLKANNDGRDLYVGDLHGCLRLLEKHLGDHGFDKKRDRLISVGDLTDRGSQSLKTLELVKEPWFHSVKGNHEEMCQSYFEGDLDEKIFINNGGEWFTKLSRQKQAYVISMIKDLPLIIDVQTNDNRLIGVLHGDALASHWNHYCCGEFNQGQVLWGRERMLDRDTRCVAGVDIVVVGHTPIRSGMAVKLGNVINIDTGGVFQKKTNNFKLTVIEDIDLFNIK